MQDFFDVIMAEIGHREDIKDLTRAKQSGENFAMAAGMQPSASLSFFIGGYDTDKRELWEIPEVMEYIRAFAEAAGLRNWKAPIITRLDEESVGLLVLSNSFAPGHPFIVRHE